MLTTNMADCLKEIQQQLAKKQTKRDVDVREVYLSDKNLVDIIDLSRFNNLKYLWLNGNRIRRITCLSQNFRLAELYLQDNCLVDITGALGHLTSLKVLFLHNNQLEKLDKVVKELQNMQHLQSLNMFDNPIAQESEYRAYVVHHIPSVELLDRKEVLKSEREAGRALYDQENKAVEDRLAFGLRSEGPPSLYYPATGPLPTTQPAEYEVGNNFYRDNPPYATEEQAVKVRHLRRSVMEYTTFDWSKVPRAEQRRLSDKSFDKPQVVTTRFR